jgi:hypothetical protein
VIALGDETTDFGELARTPSLRIVSAPANPGRIEFSELPELDSRLQRRSLTVDGVACLPPGIDGELLATVGDRPVWVQRRFAEVRHQFVGGSLTELQHGETLRDKMTLHGPFPVLPLVHFLREIAADLLYVQPPLRAAFIIDDPNLHRDSYGFITSYSSLVEHARTHAYHAVMAMVPLDARHARSSAMKLFRENEAQLSLAIHGNNHTKHELARSPSSERRLSLLAQGLNRIASFEYRTGLRVARIMVPPHSRASEASLRDLVRLGYEGVAIKRPYPWLGSAPADRPLTGWWPADLVAGGLPVLGRYHLQQPRDELILRAFLDQPLLLYCHHADVGRGFEELARAAALINELGSVDWGRLDHIARTNFACRRDGSTLRVRLHARRVELDVPEGVETLRLELPPDYDGIDHETISVDRPGDASFSLDPRVAVQGIDVTPGKMRVALLHDSRVDPTAIPSPRPRLWPLVRRRATTSRDRLAPYIRASLRL